MDFIQIQNNYIEEALFFYKNNWKVLRVQAAEKGYIDSFMLLKTDASDEAPFELVLVTTYSSLEQYNSREDNFADLMQNSDGPILLNEIPPNQFRKTLFSKEKVLMID